MLPADLVGGLDPLELEQRRHLDIGDHHVRPVLVGGGDQGWGVVGHADHLDVVLRLEQGPDALPDQDVVVPQYHPDAHRSPAPRVYDSAMPLRLIFAEDDYLVRAGTAALLA